MSELEGRVTELEILCAHQERMIGELNQNLTDANKLLALFEKRLERAEDTIKELLGSVAAPPNERPPHY